MCSKLMLERDFHNGMDEYSHGSVLGVARSYGGCFVSRVMFYIEKNKIN